MKKGKFVETWERRSRGGEKGGEEERRDSAGEGGGEKSLTAERKP